MIQPARTCASSSRSRPGGHPSTCAARPSREPRTSATCVRRSASTSWCAGLRRPATRSPTAGTSRTSTTRSCAPRRRRASPGGRLPSGTSAPLPRATSCSAAARPTWSPWPPAISPDMIALITRLIERGHAYAAGGDVYFDVRSAPGYGALSGQRLADMRPAEAEDAGTDQGGTQGGPPRLRAVEGREARRAVLAGPLGARPPGMAPGVLGHGHRLPRAHLRHPRWRRRPGLPAPRERARPVAAAGDAFRQVLGAPRPGRALRAEDEQVGRAARSRPPRRWPRCQAAGAAVLPRARRTTGPLSITHRTRWKKPSRPTSGSSGSSPARSTRSSAPRG